MAYRRVSLKCILAPLCCGVFVVFLFCVWEFKGARLPIVPMYIFKHQTVSGVFISMFVNGFVNISSLYYLPQFFQTTLGFSATRAGIFLIPLLVGQTATSWTAGMTVSRTGRYRTIVYSGFGILSIACGCISIFTARTSRATMVGLEILAGIGVGMTQQTTVIAVQASVPRKDMSVVTSFRNFIRMLGGTFSLSIASSVVNNALRSSMITLNLPSSTISTIIDSPSLLSTPSVLNITSASASYILDQGYTKGFRNFFYLNASSAVFATIISVTMIKHKELIRGDEERLRKEAKEALKARKNKRYAQKGEEERDRPEGETDV